MKKIEYLKVVICICAINYICSVFEYLDKSHFVVSNLIHPAGTLYRTSSIKIAILSLKEEVRSALDAFDG